MSSPPAPCAGAPTAAERWARLGRSVAKGCSPNANVTPGQRAARRGVTTGDLQRALLRMEGHANETAGVPKDVLSPLNANIHSRGGVSPSQDADIRGLVKHELLRKLEMARGDRDVMSEGDHAKLAAAREKIAAQEAATARYRAALHAAHDRMNTARAALAATASPEDTGMGTAGAPSPHALLSPHALPSPAVSPSPGDAAARIQHYEERLGLMEAVEAEQGAAAALMHAFDAEMKALELDEDERTLYRVWAYRDKAKAISEDERRDAERVLKGIVARSRERELHAAERDALDREAEAQMRDKLRLRSRLLPVLNREAAALTARLGAARAERAALAAAEGASAELAACDASIAAVEAELRKTQEATQRTALTADEERAHRGAAARRKEREKDTQHRAASVSRTKRWLEVKHTYTAASHGSGRSSASPRGELDPRRAAVQRKKVLRQALQQHWGAFTARHARCRAWVRHGLGVVAACAAACEAACDEQASLVHRVRRKAAVLALDTARQLLDDEAARLSGVYADNHRRHEADVGACELSACEKVEERAARAAVADNAKRRQSRTALPESLTAVTQLMMREHAVRDSPDACSVDAPSAPPTAWRPDAVLDIINAPPSMLDVPVADIAPLLAAVRAPPPPDDSDAATTTSGGRPRVGSCPSLLVVPGAGGEVSPGLSGRSSASSPSGGMWVTAGSSSSAASSGSPRSVAVAPFPMSRRTESKLMRRRHSLHAPGTDQLRLTSAAPSPAWYPCGGGWDLPQASHADPPAIVIASCSVSDLLAVVDAAPPRVVSLNAAVAEAVGAAQRALRGAASPQGLPDSSQAASPRTGLWGDDSDRTVLGVARVIALAACAASRAAAEEAGAPSLGSLSLSATCPAAASPLARPPSQRKLLPLDASALRLLSAEPEQGRAPSPTAQPSQNPLPKRRRAGTDCATWAAAVAAQCPAPLRRRPSRSPKQQEPRPARRSRKGRVKSSEEAPREEAVRELNEARGVGFVSDDSLEELPPPRRSPHESPRRRRRRRRACHSDTASDASSSKHGISVATLRGSTLGSLGSSAPAEAGPGLPEASGERIASYERDAAGSPTGTLLRGEDDYERMALVSLRRVSLLNRFEPAAAEAAAAGSPRARSKSSAVSDATRHRALSIMTTPATIQLSDICPSEASIPLTMTCSRSGSAPATPAVALHYGGDASSPVVARCFDDHSPSRGSQGRCSPPPAATDGAEGAELVHKSCGDKGFESCGVDRERAERERPLAGDDRGASHVEGLGENADWGLRGTPSLEGIAGTVGADGAAPHEDGAAPTHEGGGSPSSGAHDGPESSPMLSVARAVASVGLEDFPRVESVEIDVLSASDRDAPPAWTLSGRHGAAAPTAAPPRPGRRQSAPSPPPNTFFARLADASQPQPGARQHAAPPAGQVRPRARTFLRRGSSLAAAPERDAILRRRYSLAPLAPKTRPRV
eukprot:TRINITY_DN1952_c0_g1_i1.p1 TRINITY_DN1952_c0_g1~~TRINITY_DN1952_c0_g1_i1.p1  ORF type:complete len:1454 (+),score=342.81 TRINITY_DN1952_c0_g1_i1:69-4430(+)